MYMWIFLLAGQNTKEDRNKRASQNNNSTRRTHTNCQPTNCRQMKSRKNRPYIRRRRQNCGPLKQPELRCPAWTRSMIDSSADDGYGTEPLEKYSPTIGIDNEPLYPIPENTHRQRRRHLLGVLLVLAVIIIWVSSSILIQVWYLPHLTIPMHKAHPPHFTQLHPRTPIGYTTLATINPLISLVDNISRLRLWQAIFPYISVYFPVFCLSLWVCSEVEGVVSELGILS